MSREGIELSANLNGGATCPSITVVARFFQKQRSTVQKQRSTDCGQSSLPEAGVGRPIQTDRPGGET
jgi:hypothetical protein